MAVQAGNNFNLLRLAAASLVMVSHGIELPTAVAKRDFAHGLTGFTLSWYAVSIFFAISGFLIVESWIRRPHLRDFLWARAIRIMPALAVMLVVTILFLGFFLGAQPISAFLEQQKTLKYFFGNLSIVLVQYELPGVFTENPLPAVNGSLWTLRYEIFCYALVAALGVSGILARPRARLAALSAILVMTLVLAADVLPLKGLQKAHLTQILEFGRLSTCFLLGALFRDLQGRLPLNPWVLAFSWLGVLAAARSPLSVPVACAASAYTTFFIAFVPQASWLGVFRAHRDYSYGVYIYAFPVQQTLIALLPGAGLEVTIGAAFLLTLGLAMLSWHIVEKPALRLKRSLRMAGPLQAIPNQP